MADQPYPGRVPPPPLPGTEPWPPAPQQGGSAGYPGFGAPQHGAPSNVPGFGAPPQVPSPSYPGFGAPPAYGAPPQYGALPQDGAPQYGAYGRWGAPPPPKKRRVGLAVTLSLLAVATVVGATGYAMWMGASESTYQAAVLELKLAQDAVVAANTAGTTVVADAEAQLLDADTVGLTVTAGLLDATFAQKFADSVTELDAALASPPEKLISPRSPSAMPDTPWEREEAAVAIETRADNARDDVADYNRDIAVVKTAATNVDLAAAAYFGSASASAETILAANISAKNETKVSFQDAAASLAKHTTLDSGSVVAVGNYVDAAAALATSQQAELNEKAGPLMTSRLAVEQFARDLAPGLMLDFDWAPIVSGSGEGLSVGGTAHWWMDSGFATLTFSNSVADLWGTQYDDMVRALVAHEVGHALTLRCGDMYDWSTQESIEQWATAWAIVNGYTGEGNGVSVYGYPPQSMLDAARGCS